MISIRKRKWHKPTKKHKSPPYTELQVDGYQRAEGPQTSLVGLVPVYPDVKHHDWLSGTHLLREQVLSNYTDCGGYWL